MDDEIVLAREHDGFRVISGRHRLGSMLGLRNEAFADVAGESGRAMVFRSEQRLLVCKDSRHLPLLDATSLN